MQNKKIQKSETTSLSHKSSVGTTTSLSSTWNGSHASKQQQRQKDELTSKMDTLQHEFTQQDTDEDGYITLKQLHSLFSTLNMIPPSQLQRFMNLVALHKSNLFTPGGQRFSLQETQQYHFLLERVAGMQPHIAQKFDTPSLMKIVQSLDEPSGILSLKDIYQTHELAFIRTMFQSLHRDEQGLIPFLEVQSAVRKVQQENPKLTPERTEEILILLLDKSTTYDLKQKRPSNALLNFGTFAKGFLIMETVLDAFPLLGGHEAPASSNNGTTPHPPAPTTPLTSKTLPKEPSARPSVSSIPPLDHDSDDEPFIPNTFSTIPIVPPVSSPRQHPLPSPSVSAIHSSQTAYTYDPTPELFIEEVAPYRITPHSPGSEPSLAENQAYQIRSRWKLYPVGAGPANNNNVPQKMVSESILQTPVKSPPSAPTSRSQSPRLSNGTPSLDAKLAVEKRITEEIIKLRQQLLEQRRKLADANLMYQHQQQTHEESIVHLKDNHQQQLNHLQQQIDQLKNQMRGGRDSHTSTHKSVNTELNIAELLLHSQNYNNNNAALQNQYDEQSQAIEELRRNLEQLHADETQLKRQLAELQEVNDKLKESLQENDEAAQENEVLRSQIEELVAELQQANSQKTHLQTNLTETQQTEISLKTHVSTLVQQHKHIETNLKTQLNELNLVKEDQDKQLAQLVAELQKCKQCKSDKEALQRNYQEALAVNSQLEETIKILNERLSVAESNTGEKFSQYQKDVDHLTQQHQQAMNSLQEKLVQVQQTHSQQEQKWKQEQQQQREKTTTKLQEFEKEINNYRNQLVEQHNLQERLKNSTAVQQEQKQEITSLQQTIAEQKQTIEQLQSKSHSSDSTKEKLQQELDQLKRTLQEKDRSQEDLSSQIRNLKSEQAQQVHEIETLQQQLKNAQQGFQNQQEKTVNEFKKKETELQKDTEKLKIREQELITEITTLKSQNTTTVQQNQHLASQVQSQNQQHSAQVADLQKQLKELQDQNKKLSDEHSKAETTQENLKKQIAELISINEGLLGQVEQTQQQVEEVQSKRQQDTDSKVKNLQDDLNALRQQLNTANREKTEHSQKITQLQSEKDRLHSIESNLASELKNMKSSNENLQNQLNQAQQEINNIRRAQEQSVHDTNSQTHALENALNQAAARIAELEALQNNQQDTQQQVSQKVQQVQQQYAERETEFRNRVEKEKLLWKQKLKAQTDEVTNTIASKLNEFSAKLAREAEQRIQLQQQNQQLQQRLAEALNSRPTENGSNNYDEEIGAMNSRVRHQNDEIELLKREIENLKMLISKMENDEQATKMQFANFQKESKQAQDQLQAEKSNLESHKDRLSRALIELNNKLNTERTSKPDSNRLHMLELGLKKLEQENKQLKSILQQHEINFENLGSPRGSNSEFTTTRRTETRYVTHSTPIVTRDHSPHHHIHYPSHDMPNLPNAQSDSNADLLNRVSSLRNRLDELNSSPSPIKSPPQNFVNTQHHYDFVYHNNYHNTYNNNNSIPSTPQPAPRSKTPEPPISSESEEEPSMDKYFQSEPRQLPPFYEEDDSDEFSFSPPQEFHYEPQPPVIQERPTPQPTAMAAPVQAQPLKQPEPEPESEPEPEVFSEPEEPAFAPPTTPNTSQVDIIPTDSPPMDLGNISNYLDEEEEGYGFFDMEKFLENEVGVENNNQMMAELAKVYKDDEVSKKLAAMVASNAELKKYVPFNSKRLEKGVYQIGNKKLQMKIINRDLMVRVGGGYMKFEDYLKRHQKNLRPTSESELKKEKEAHVDKDVHSLVVFPKELKLQQQESKKVWK